MTGASKILTVSYGTFSCTLEGFDDPFNTMRAIAEYFRDLAADDRYFGAEPPTPDAAMLHKIAEREIQRRVEAKVQDNGVILRADDQAPPRVTMPAHLPAAPTVAATPAPTVASQAEAAPAVESAAARLSRLRAAQTQILAPAPAALGTLSSRFADVEAYAEDQEADAPEAVAAPIAILPEPAPVFAVAVAAPETAPEPEITQPAEQIAAAPPPHVAPSPSFDIALDNITALLAADTPAPAPAPQPAADPDTFAALRETLAGLIGQDDQLAADMSAAADPAPVDLSPVNLPDDAPLPEDFADDTALDQIADYDLTDLVKLDAAPAQDDPITAPLIDDAAYLDDTAAEPAPLPAVAAAPDAPIVADKIQRARARVIKIRRLDKVPPEADAPLTPALTPEAEADLQNALAALEAEIAPTAAPEPQPDPATDLSVEAQLDAELADLTPTDAPPAPEPLAEAKIAPADDASVDRLLAQTNTQLEVPEVKRRRSAIAHLKAAVLATVADRKINPNAGSKVAEVKMDPYRKDLDQAVRPGAPSDRPAPLVLVSAQRIDTKRDLVADAARPVPQIVPSVQSQPVRPRRVTAGGVAHAVSTLSLDEADGALSPEAMDNIFADGSKQSFSDFAESLGADTMAELIEAAGAYCTLVLERPSFTRPLLFQQISTMPNMGDLSREDGLRGFGRLLRDGRIQKTVRGQFALSTTSPLLNEAKRIAG